MASSGTCSPMTGFSSPYWQAVSVFHILNVGSVLQGTCMACKSDVIVVPDPVHPSHCHCCCQDPDVNVGHRASSFEKMECQET